MATILISHDFGVIERNVDRVAVMYAGQIVESGDVTRVVDEPRHPYAWGLIQSVHQMRAGRGTRLLSIPGTPPSPSDDIVGCRFADRCQFVMPVCREIAPPSRPLPDGQYLSWLEEPPGSIAAPPEEEESAEERVTGEALLRVDDLVVSYGPRRRVLRRGSGRPAVDGVSLVLHEGETLGLVGESGSGKSSAGRAMLRLAPISDGSIEYLGRDVGAMSSRAFQRYARDVKMVFQDPMASLDPRMTVLELVEEPLRVHRVGGGAVDRRREVVRVLSLVGLGEDFVQRYPHELSGGQRQRVSLARSLVLSPRVLICDEPVSALDVSVQAQVINLLAELRSKLSLTYLFVSHDLNIVRYLADRVAVMYQGKIVELGPTEDVYRDPQHPYTRSLLLAADGYAASPEHLAEGSPVAM